MRSKTKTKENKIVKFIRHLASLGVTGAIMFLFPNVIITNLSMLVGVLVGKGVISWATGITISTFLGSQLGILLQNGIIAILTFTFSNLTLLLSTKLFGKLKKHPKQKNNNQSQIQTLSEENIIDNVIVNEQSLERDIVRTESVQNPVVENSEYVPLFEPEVESHELENENNETVVYTKTLGSHPMYRKK